MQATCRKRLVLWEALFVKASKSLINVGWRSMMKYKHELHRVIISSMKVGLWIHLDRLQIHVWKLLNVLVTHDMSQHIGSNFVFSPLVAAATRALGPLYVAKQRQPKEGTILCHLSRYDLSWKKMMHDAWCWYSIKTHIVCILYCRCIYCDDIFLAIMYSCICTRMYFLTPVIAICKVQRNSNIWYMWTEWHVLTSHQRFGRLQVSMVHKLKSLSFDFIEALIKMDRCSRNAWRRPGSCVCGTCGAVG